jgi:hypothetical protein
MDCNIWILYEGDSLDYINVNDNIADKIKFIDEQFEGECLDRITIYNNQVSFSFEENAYGIVYRKDDMKPQFMNYSSELFDIAIKKLENNWYYCESK